MGTRNPASPALSEGTLRAVLDALPLAVVVIDGDGRAVYRNPLAERLLGDALELGQTVRWGATEGRPGGAGENGVGDFEWGSADATAASIPSAAGGMLRPMTIALPGGEGVALVVLTAVSSAEKSYLDGDTAERLREVEALARLGSWSWDLEADVMSWSDESYRLFGLAPHAVPVNYEDIRLQMHPDNRAQSEQAIDRCRRTGEGFAYTRRVVLADGSVRWHQGRAQAVMADGRTVRMFGTVQDVTERVLTEQTLGESLERGRELAEENETLRAEIETQLEETRASRARMVRAADDARRRLERDLHDGAQQRLTTLGLILRSAQAHLDAGADPALQRALDEAIAELKAGLSELRALARGLHPTILTDEGLLPALRALTGRSPVPVKLLGPPLGRLPRAVETAAYFVVAEALTNVAKHAATASVLVTVELADGTLIVEITDDGSGGATIDAGSGLRGLSDRIAALDGRVQLESSIGRGTRLRAELPCA
jgi:PAS domain S-box-containing protein